MFRFFLSFFLFFFFHSQTSKRKLVRMKKRGIRKRENGGKGRNKGKDRVGLWRSPRMKAERKSMGQADNLRPQLSPFGGVSKCVPVLPLFVHAFSTRLFRY